jgi:hypothetical protein
MAEIKSNMAMGRIRNPDHFKHKRGAYLHACSSIVVQLGKNVGAIFTTVSVLPIVLGIKE